MELIKNEIFTQASALAQTKELLLKCRQELTHYLHQPYRRFIFLGCGSGYMLSSGAAAMFSLHTDKKAVAFAGGEVMVNPAKYADIFTGALVIVCSRSGETSEVAISLLELKKLTDFKTLGILAKEESTLKSMMDFSLEIPWAFDESVCQTRNISNFYYALTMLCAFYNGDETLEESFSSYIKEQTEYLSKIEPDCKKIAGLGWNNVTILADGEIYGIASEGGLAFTEISILPGDCFHLLDYRHGPIVLANPQKLIIALLNPTEKKHQKQMISDLRKRGSYVITLGPGGQDFWDSDYHVSLDSILRYEVWGLALVNLCQVLAFHKALACGHDPDIPEGLNPFVKL